MTCSKPFSITVSSPIDMLYWRMGEFSGDRIDDVHGIAISEHGSGISRTAGKIAFGVLLASFDFSATAGLYSDTGAGILYTGSGMTMCGWFKFDSLPAGTQFTVGWEDFGFNSTSFYSDTAGATMAIISNGVLQAITVPAAGVFNFFVMWFDPAGTLNLEFNRSGTVFTMPGASAPSLVDATIARFTSGAGELVAMNLVVDEIALIPQLLTVAQKNYIYNGGAGRTYPLNLP